MSDRQRDKSSVGYGHPPRHSQFRPGQSGNPSGKSKATHDLRWDLLEVMNKKLQIRENGKTRRISGQRAILLTLLESALDKDPRAITILTNLLLKANPPTRSEPVEEEALSVSDVDIVLDFLRRHRDLALDLHAKGDGEPHCDEDKDGNHT